MLIACAACHRQYDVADLEPGARVRCFCGELQRVPRHRSRQVPMQHCSSCGAALKAKEPRCEYCEAEIQLGDRGWGETCPECFARMVKGARFCGACGVRIEPRGALQPLEGRACPRCQQALSLCAAGTDEALVECTGCGGVWLSAETFARFTQREQARSVAAFVPRREKDEELPSLPREGTITYLPCPVCGDLMNRKNFAGVSGIILDWCRAHGYWFDLHELEHVQRFVEGGGLDRARERRLAREKLELERQRERAAAALPVRGAIRSAPRFGGSLLDALGWALLESLFD